jgi:hypothetical protein
MGLASEDYYFENGLMIFTEAYHRKRGFCCGNRCRHCPYEHANVPGNVRDVAGNGAKET